MDTIHIHGLKLACIIGTERRERARRQAVVVSVGLHGDFRKSGRRDRLEDAVDYAAVRDRIVALVKVSRFHLVEALAQAVADICLVENKIVAVDVTVEKPGALRCQGRVAVEIHRIRARR